jgi:hypothetical protein
MNNSAINKELIKTVNDLQNGTTCYQLKTIDGNYIEKSPQLTEMLV